jgi:hypothetical protein
MRVKIERALKKPRKKIPRWLDNWTEKLRPRKSFVRFSTINNDLSIMEVNQIQINSNPLIQAEAERQQCNGLIYVNISRFR